MLRHVPLALLVLGLLAVPALASDEASSTEPTGVAKAEALLKEGKFTEARDAYVALAKADPENAELVKQVALLTQVIELQSFVQTEEPSPAWERAAVGLHAFYVGKGMLDVALKHGRAMHAKGKSDVTASLVAEVLLEKNANEEVVEFVENLRARHQTPQNLVYECIALARLDRKEEVAEIVRLYGLPKEMHAGLRLDVARMQMALGRTARALDTLQKAFESCPEQQLDALKGYAKRCSDFAPLVGKTAFTKVLETKSKASGGCASGGCAEGGCGGGCGEKSADTEGGGCCGDCGGAEPEKPEEGGGCCGDCGGK